VGKQSTKANEEVLAMPITNMQEKFMHELSDIYDAEHQFLEAQEQMLQEASDEELKGMIQEHIDQTQQQIQNLEQVYSQLGQQPERVTCKSAQGLVSEGQEVMQEAGSGPICDTLIAGSQAKVEHYEIASYQGLVTGAQQMGQQEILNLLQQNLQQEEQTARRIEQSAPQLLQKAAQVS
jgi:ferritin-like metal-binding protein YciE